MTRIATVPRIVLTSAAFALMCLPAMAQQQQPAAKPAPKAADTKQGAPVAGQPSASQGQAAQTFPVSIEQSLYLIRSTLMRVDDAGRSGNYTVLRDLAAPGFQQQHSAASLAGSLAELRSPKYQLASVALIAPQLTAPPQIDANKLLRLSGLFPLQPQPVAFDLAFEAAGGEWRLLNISVGIPQLAQAPAAAAPAQAAPAAAAKQAAGDKGKK
jgi:hypothetical protein